MRSCPSCSRPRFLPLTGRLRPGRAARRLRRRPGPPRPLGRPPVWPAARPGARRHRHGPQPAACAARQQQYDQGGVWGGEVPGRGSRVAACTSVHAALQGRCTYQPWQPTAAMAWGFFQDKGPACPPFGHILRYSQALHLLRPAQPSSPSRGGCQPYKGTMPRHPYQYPFPSNHTPRA